MLRHTVFRCKSYATAGGCNKVFSDTLVTKNGAKVAVFFTAKRDINRNNG